MRQISLIISVPLAEKIRMKKYSLWFFALTFFLNTQSSTHAAAIEQKVFHFRSEPQELMNGDMHFAFDLVTVRELYKKYPDMVELDTLGKLNLPKVKVAISKAIFVVDKPVGFFDHEKMDNQPFVSHILGEQKLTKIAKQTYRVEVPGTGLKYLLKSYFDSDDISTLPHSRIIAAVTATRRMDVMAQSSNSIFFREYSEFNESVVGAVNAMSFVPLKENKTVVILYQLTVLKNVDLKKKTLRESVVSEFLSTRDLINSFQD